MISLGSSNKILIPLENDNENPIFPEGFCDIDNRIVNVLVEGSLSEDPCKSKVALFNLSQVNQCALKCLGNPFFKALFSLQRPLVADFEFTLFSSSLPNVYKVLCDVLPTMSTFKDTSRMEAYSRGEGGYASGGEEAKPTSSFKFKRSFLEMGHSTQNAYQGPRGSDEELLLKYSYFKRNDKERLFFGEYNSLLFHELGRAKLQEEILGSVPFLEKCGKLAADMIIAQHTSKREIKVILELIDSCSWVIKRDLVGNLSQEYCFEEDEDENEWMANYIPEHLEEFQHAIADTIADAMKPVNSMSSLLQSLAPISHVDGFDTDTIMET